MNTQELNLIYKWARFALIALVAFLTVAVLGGLKDLRHIEPSYNTMTVMGQGEAFSLPDIASFSFTVSADATTVSAAQEDVTKKMDKVLAALKGLEIEEKDIKTTDYSVYPRYSYTQGVCTFNSCPPSRQVLEGYTASHNVTVKVRKTEEAGQALAAAGENGATGLSNISFTVDDPEALKAEARVTAIEEARKKAELLADELGVKLVRVVNFSDSSDGDYPAPYYGREGMGGDMAVAQSKAPTLPVGENKINVVVNITYEIR